MSGPDWSPAKSTYKTDMFAASTPPLEAKKLLFSMMASLRKDAKGRPLELAFIDVKKAYFNAVPKRVIHLVPPKELGLPAGYVARLRRCAYGTRDAGLLWEETYSDRLTDMGFTRGTASPCVFVHKKRGLRCVVHGDDFTLLGCRSELLWFEKTFTEHVEIKLRARIGESHDCDKSITILNRVLKLEPWGLSYEADPGTQSCSPKPSATRRSTLFPRRVSATVRTQIRNSTRMPKP